MIINFGVGFYGYTEVLGLALMVSGLSECSSDGLHRHARAAAVTERVRDVAC